MLQDVSRYVTEFVTSQSHLSSIPIVNTMCPQKGKKGNQTWTIELTNLAKQSGAKLFMANKFHTKSLEYLADPGKARCCSINTAVMN